MDLVGGAILVVAIAVVSWVLLPRPIRRDTMPEVTAPEPQSEQPRAPIG